MLGLFLYFVLLCALAFTAVTFGVIDVALKVATLICLVMTGTYLFLGFIGLLLKEGNNNGTNS